jgi:hypothetical protein
VGQQQRIVFWNDMTMFLSARSGNPGVIDLEPESLKKNYPEIAAVIGHGRVISHAIQYWGPGILMTLLVEY